MSSGWRGLKIFWLAVLLTLGVGAIILQLLGPPQPHRVATVQPSPMPAPVPTPARPPPLVSAARGIPPALRPGRDTPGPVADPEPQLLEPGPDGGMLPRISPDGRMPMQVYASGFDHSNSRPRIGLIVAGIGMDAAASDAAIHDLPRGVTLAVSPYADHLGQILVAARLAEHEYLLSLPMEPQAYPLNDPGPRALMTRLSKADNLQRLNWLLSHVQGYVGVTGALGNGLQGERFANVPEQMTPVLQQVAQRGLLYVDAQPGQKPLPEAWNLDVTVLVDQPPSDVETKLTQLERVARDQGSALGLVLVPRPVTVQRIATWARGLQDRGFALAPVSALVQAPARIQTPTETRTP